MQKTVGLHDYTRCSIWTAGEHSPVSCFVRLSGSTSTGTGAEASGMPLSRHESCRCRLYSALLLRRLRRLSVGVPGRQILQNRFRFRRREVFEQRDRADSTRPRRLPFLIAMQGHAYMVCHCLRSRFYRRELSSEFEASSISRYPSITPSIKRG